jgi:MFS family permease
MQFALALFGASLVERVGRRPLLLFANIGCAATWVGAIIASSNNAKTQSKQSGAGVVAMVFLFDAIFSIGFTPLQALYPVEVLSFEMRAKGMAFSNFAVSAGMFPSNFLLLGWVMCADEGFSNPGESVRVPCCTEENHLEDVHCFRHLVSNPSSGYLLLYP